MAMKVLFLQNNWMENFGIINISSVLKAAGHKTDLLIEESPGKLLKFIKNAKPDIIAFSCTTGIHKWVVRTAEKIKSEISVPVIVGGPHPTFFPQMIEEPSIDFICRGEGEYPMLDLANALSKGEDYTLIPNLWIKKDARIIRNEIRPLLSDLNNLPITDRSIYYKYSLFRKNPTKFFLSGRGCPYKCSYCCNHTYQKLYKDKGQYVRQQSVERIITEIKGIREAFGMKTVWFHDDIFVLNLEWTREFCDRYKNEIKLPFSCTIRPNLATEELVAMLKKAGCYNVTMGVESGNDYLRNEILKRKMTSEEIIQAGGIIKKYGIRLRAFNMLGIPGETLQSALETIRLNIRLSPDHPWCSIYQPYPGTELADFARGRFIPENFNIDTVDDSYFKNSKLQMNNSLQIQNLQKFFPFVVRYPKFLPIAIKLSRYKSDKLYTLFFYINYTFNIFKEYRFNLKSLLILIYKSLRTI